MGSVIYTMQVFSTPHHHLKAVLYVLASVSRKGHQTHTTRTGEGVGSSKCLGPARGLTGGHVFSMTFCNSMGEAGMSRDMEALATEPSAEEMYMKCEHLLLLSHASVINSSPFIVCPRIT